MQEGNKMFRSKIIPVVESPKICFRFHACHIAYLGNEFWRELDPRKLEQR